MNLSKSDLIRLLKKSKKPKLLVACEFSGRVRDSFKEKGWLAISCDMIPSERPGYHYIGDVRDLLKLGWDMLIAFPPCRYIAFSGMRWCVNNPKRVRLQKLALGFVRLLLNSPIPKVCLENPVGVIPRNIWRWTQTIQPYQFRHPETKKTCLWLRGLPKLQSEHVVIPLKGSVIHKMRPGRDRERNRSRTYWGIAHAMANQWGNLM